MEPSTLRREPKKDANGNVIPPTSCTIRNTLQTKSLPERRAAERPDDGLPEAHRRKDHHAAQLELHSLITRLRAWSGGPRCCYRVF